MYRIRKKKAYDREKGFDLTRNKLMMSTRKGKKSWVGEKLSNQILLLKWGQVFSKNSQR